MTLFTAWMPCVISVSCSTLSCQCSSMSTMLPGPVSSASADWNRSVDFLDHTSRLSAFVLSRLDYCNGVLTSLPKSTVAPLQLVQNAGARLVARLGPRDHVMSALQHFDDLHWLLIPQRIMYRLYLLMHLVSIRCAPSYLMESVTATAALSSTSHLHSASSCHYEKQKLMWTGFHVHHSTQLEHCPWCIAGTA